MTDMGVKQEVKPEAADSKDLADLEEYEEDTDLHIPPNPPQGWLTSIPKELWQAWNEQYKDADPDKHIEIGKLRVHHKNGDQGPQNQRLELFLNPANEDTKTLPQSYTLKVNTSSYTNSAVFSEKDLPGHKSQPFGRGRNTQAQKPTGVDKAARLAAAKKFGGYASAIPKQVALAAKINHECTLVPMQDDKHYLEHLQRSLTQAMAPKVATTFHLGVDRRMVPGTQNGVFSSFTTTSKPGKGKKKVSKEKNVRMEQPALFDALEKCFRRYKYWSLKALRNELRQPESFIKGSLEQIATLVRSGDFAMQYVLKPEYAASIAIKDEDVPNEVAKVESAEGEGETDMASGEDEEDFGDLEDVKMNE